jgi:hypothetical protein
MGQLGHKKLENSHYPVKVELTDSIKELSCGSNISGLITTEGKLYL